MKWRSLIEIILLGCAWGPSFLFIKLAVQEMSPFALAASRVGMAALLMVILLKIRGRKVPRLGKIWFHFFVLGFFSASLPFLLFSFAEMRVSSALAGMINGCTPIVTAVLAHFVISDERLNLSRAFGVGLGLAGFCVILVPHLMDGMIDGDDWSIIALGIASISYGVGMVYGRKYLQGLPRMVGPTCHLMVSSIYLIPLALIFEPMFTPENPLTWTGVLAVSGLALFGTAIAFYLFFRILEHSGAAYLSMSTYLLPLFATILGWVFLDEKLKWTTYLAGALILLGMMVVNGTIRVPFLNRQKISTDLD